MAMANLSPSETWALSRPLPTTNWVEQQYSHIDSVNGVAYGQGLFVAVSDDPAVIVSTNGADWIERPTATMDGLHAVVHGDQGFVAVGSDVISSADGFNWVRHGVTIGSWPSGSKYLLHSITSGNGYYVTVGDAGTILGSADGTNWLGRRSGMQSTL